MTGVDPHSSTFWSDLLPLGLVARSTAELVLGPPTVAELAAARGSTHGATGDHRLHEFRTGRWCASRALTALEPDGAYDTTWLGRDSDGRPSWPWGAVGAITHTEGLVAVVVGRAREWRGVGVDAEPKGRRVSVAAFEYLAPSPAERCDQLAWPRSMSSERYRLTLLSAQESAFKTWSNRDQPDLDLAEIRITLGPEGDFEAVNGSARLLGRWRHTCTHVVTAAWDPAAPCSWADGPPRVTSA